MKQIEDLSFEERCDIVDALFKQLEGYRDDINKKRDDINKKRDEILEDPR